MHLISLRLSKLSWGQSALSIEQARAACIRGRKAAHLQLGCGGCPIGCRAGPCSQAGRPRGCWQARCVCPQPGSRQGARQHARGGAQWRPAPTKQAAGPAQQAQEKHIEHGGEHSLVACWREATLGTPASRLLVPACTTGQGGKLKGSMTKRLQSSTVNTTQLPTGRMQTGRQHKAEARWRSA